MRAFKSAVFLLTIPFFLFFAFKITPSTVSSQEPDLESVESIQENQELNSFELFWPIVAGRTKGDFLYPLKRLKENVRGVLVRGFLNKADYQVFLATKRIVEAEKLINNNSSRNAQKTLSSAYTELAKAEKNLQKAKEKNEQLAEKRANIEKQLNNIEIFLKWLSTKQEGEIKTLIDKVLKQAITATSKI